MTERHVAVVTGASTGIGEATALRLARDGYRVVATMRTPDRSTLPEVASAEGIDLTTAALDVDSDESVDAAFSTVVEHYGRVDVLVANAGIGGGGGTFEEATLDDFRSTMETNLFGAMRCIKAVLPQMRERRSGTIVGMSSQAGRIAPPTMPAYAASKWALEGALESLAASVVAFGVRVAIVEPGTILTPIFGKGEMRPGHADYQLARDVFMGMLMHDLERGSDPSVVADCVADAIATDDPKLRYLVGQGAERNVGLRDSLGDEAYLALQLLPAEEQIARMTRTR
jgi:NAD(P)-dependent dehydrogenase (short-subunit alcohol dehydrogenase family)